MLVKESEIEKVIKGVGEKFMEKPPSSPTKLSDRGLREFWSPQRTRRPNFSGPVHFPANFSQRGA